MSYLVIPLGRGYETIVDMGSPALGLEWKANIAKKNHDGEPMVYARRHNPITQKTEYLHRMIMNAQAGEFIDHKNGNTLDNRLSNLRRCTRSQNAINCRDYKNTSGYRGVSLLKNGTFRVGVRDNGKWRHVGMYKSIIEAALAYDAAAKHLQGEFAVLNFPE